MEPLIDDRITNWLNTLDVNFVQTGITFDFTYWAYYIAYDIMSDIGFGAPFGFVEQGKDVGGVIQGVRNGFPHFGVLSRLHPFTRWVKTTPLKRFLVASPSHPSGIGVLMRFRDKLIDKRLQDLQTSKDLGRIDLLQTFLNARTEDDMPLDIENVRAEVLIVLIAGADTTGTTFQSLIQLLLANPDVHKRIMEEIDSAARNGLISDMPQYSEVVENLPYYTACIRETLRLLPPAPSIIPRCVSAPGMSLYGKFVPAGTEITSHPWIVHRDRELYGEDADEFRPERWLDQERETLYKKYDLSFGYGARVCLGKNIAMMELLKGPLQFLRQFQFEVVPSKPTAKFTVGGGVGHWTDMWVTISKRSSTSQGVYIPSPRTTETTSVKRNINRDHSSSSILAAE
ncbi:cytochrome P450 monooxygenase [Penicillium vulpinum]|uniref:Cytochrome P450 n=1 Tax=Penicillium vulpinum TaxID=29845 RepID=A0A1V6S1B8_9EURO|nr:cytochrome P450 monooxygenase [Penicillium vulpinum]KAJ5950450.1 cytochrome P450 monooxygenase [Penicillium vulpinum]OQE07825.1 hypothetical protein PENVUL_c012G00826 [Penicillium vulpinum]